MYEMAAYRPAFKAFVRFFFSSSLFLLFSWQLLGSLMRKKLSYPICYLANFVPGPQILVKLHILENLIVQVIQLSLLLEGLLTFQIYIHYINAFQYFCNVKVLDVTCFRSEGYFGFT